MNRIQRAIAKVIGIEPAVKALTRPGWWGDVWNTSALGEGGTYGNTPAGWRGAVNSNVWAYNCVKARMSLVAQAPLKMYEGEGPDRKEIEKHAILELLQEVNTVNLNKRSFMRGIEQQLSIYGRCLVHKNRAGRKVHELFILPMEYVEPLPDEDVWLAGYRWLPTGEVIPREDVIDFFYPSANGSVYADSPAAVALNSINRYNLADKSQASIDRRGGQKGGIVVHAKDEIQEDYYRIRDEWDRKRNDPEQAGRDLHVPYGTDWRGDAFSATEMQREERNQRLAKEIMAAFSVPPAAAGDYRDASVLANAATQMSAFWNMWGVDELKFIAEELTYSLLWAEWKDTKNAGMYFEHDLSDIQALREDADALANRAIVLYQGAVVSLNEARELAGFDRADDPAADQIPVPEQPAPVEDMPTDTTGDAGAMDEQLVADDAEVADLTDEVDSLLDELDVNAAKALGRPEKGDRDGDGIFNEGSKPAGGAKVSPVTGRSLKPEGPSAEEKKAAKDKERAQKKAAKDKEREQKKAETAKLREQKKAEAQKVKEQKAAAKKQAQVDQLDAEYKKLDDAYNSIKDRTDVDPKLKQKVIDTMAKVQAKRNSILFGQSEATSGVLQDVARLPTKASSHTGVMVALMLSPADAARIEEQIPEGWKDEGVAVEPPANYHVTLCYLGDSANFDAMTKAKILANVEYTAQRFTVPARVTIKGAGRFVNPEMDAIWAGVAADGLANMQSTIVQNLRETGVTIPDDHGDYKPHMTLGYVEGGKPATVPPIQPVKASFPSVTVMWGGERYDFPMGGNEAYRSVTAKAFMPVVDFVGMTAVDNSGGELGTIEKIHRFGTFDGIEATKAVPVVIIAGKAYSADDVNVVVEYGEETDDHSA